VKHKNNVAVMILNWNRKAFLLECLKSLLEMDTELNEIIVVDNNSTDGSADAVKQAYPEVKVIENDRNYGAIGGKNIGLKEAMKSSADYIYMLDNDMINAKNTLNVIFEVAEKDPKVGSIAPVMYDYSRPDIILSAGAILDYTQNISRGIGQNVKDVGQFKETKEVDFLWGGALLVRKSVLEEIGLFDPNYIGYWFEDTDLSVRIYKAGYKNLICPASKVWHQPHATVEQFSYRKKYLAARNAVCFMKKHANFKQWCKYLVFVAGGVPWAFVRDVFLGRGPGGAFGKARGFIDGVLGIEKYALELTNAGSKGNVDK